MLSGSRNRCKAGFSILFLVWASRSSAQEQNAGLEAAPIRLSPHPAAFIAARGGQKIAPGPDVVARLSFLDRPLSVVAAGPAPEGSKSNVIAGALLLETGLSHTFQTGWDAGLAMGLHLHQWGQGFTLIQGQATPLASFGVMDPILETGYSFRTSSGELRPFAAVYLPLGTPPAFSAERKTRIEAGVSAAGQYARWRWGAEASLMYRPVLEFSSTRWGTQAKIAIASDFKLGAGLFLGPELLLRPLLTPQKNDTRTLLFPAEALVKLAYESTDFSCRLAYGWGLPISRVEGDIVKDARYFRAPSSPIGHGLLECSYVLGRPQRTPAKQQRTPAKQRRPDSD